MVTYYKTKAFLRLMASRELSPQEFQEHFSALCEYLNFCEEEENGVFVLSVFGKILFIFLWGLNIGCLVYFVCQYFQGDAHAFPFLLCFCLVTIMLSYFLLNAWSNEYYRAQVHQLFDECACSPYFEANQKTLATFLGFSNEKNEV